MRVLLLSTYDLGHQPFALASLSAAVSKDGAEVICNDLAVEPLKEEAVKNSSLIALHLAMHTATRLALQLLPRLRILNPNAHICFFGLYAPMLGNILVEERNMSFIGGEFETAVKKLCYKLNGSDPFNSHERNVTIIGKYRFQVPDRTKLPTLDNYAYLEEANGDRKITGYTEASRGCKHVCLHCPVVPVYGGRFFIVPVDIVMKDIRQLVEAGAEHISFGDPDFFNGPKHALDIIAKLHVEFPHLGYDVIIKVEHLLKHQQLLAVLKNTGCRFITTAVESVDDHVLLKLKKGHSTADFSEVVEITKRLDLHLSPTFIPFTPWSTVQNYQCLLKTIVDLGLVDNVASVQLSIRLLIPLGSRLLELEEIKARAPQFDQEALSYPWQFSDPQMETLANNVRQIVEEGEQRSKTRREIFMELWEASNNAQEPATGLSKTLNLSLDYTDIPKMSEAWYCCAEPTRFQAEQI